MKNIVIEKAQERLLCIISIIADLYSLTGVRIGFERDEYSVSESDGSVSLVARVLSGQLSESVVVRLTTRDITAQCIYIPCHILYCTLYLCVTYSTEHYTSVKTWFFV